MTEPLISKGTSFAECSETTRLTFTIVLSYTAPLFNLSQPGIPKSPNCPSIIAQQPRAPPSVRSRTGPCAALPALCTITRSLGQARSAMPNTCLVCAAVAHCPNRERDYTQPCPSLARLPKSQCKLCASPANLAQQLEPAPRAGL